MDVYVPLQKYEYWKCKQDWDKYWVLRDLGDASAR